VRDRSAQPGVRGGDAEETADQRRGADHQHADREIEQGLPERAARRIDVEVFGGYGHHGNSWDVGTNRRSARLSEPENVKGTTVKSHAYGRIAVKGMHDLGIAKEKWVTSLLM
jgi:hypothetical protein